MPEQSAMKFPSWIVLNFLTRAYLKQANMFPMSMLSNRFKSMVGDLWFVMAILMPFILILIISFFVFQSQFSSEFSTIIYFILMLIIWMTLMFGILNKDYANGMSAGKRTFGFIVLDYKTKETASEFQCMVRNITMYLWPVEVLLLLINPSRRLGDYLAGTEVVPNQPSDIENLVAELKNSKPISSKLLLVTLGISILLTLISTTPLILPYLQGR